MEMVWEMTPFVFGGGRVGSLETVTTSVFERNRRGSPENVATLNSLQNTNGMGNDTIRFW